MTLGCVRVDWKQRFPLTTKHFGFEPTAHAENPWGWFFYLAISTFLVLKSSVLLSALVQLLRKCTAENQVFCVLVGNISTTNWQCDLEQATPFLQCSAYLSVTQEVITDHF